jgi:GDP-4-dehydro-6-deoxy-D-mannose reductase
MQALITGIAGFVAGHLMRLLHECGVEVSGTYRPGLEPAGFATGLHVWPADLADRAALSEALRATSPDWVFHLAGLSSEPEARQHPEQAYAANFLGTLHLLEAAHALEHRPRVILAGSSAEYGLVHPEENPVREEQPLRPVSPYGVSKAAMGLLAFQYGTEHGLEILHVRAFNHTGPGQREGFAASSFACQIAEAEAGLRPPEIEVGNLSARRDLSDVRDVARAYVALAERGAPGQVYNVGSGRAVAIQEVLDQLISLSRIPIRAVPSPARFRPVDVPLLQADITRVCSATGWQPQISLPQTLADLLEGWREHVAGIRKYP